MASIRCGNCNLVNFATDANCKRCGQPLGAAQQQQSPPYANYQQPGNAYHYPAASPGNYAPQQSYQQPYAYQQNQYQQPSPAYGMAQQHYQYPPAPYAAAYAQGFWRDGSTLVMYKHLPMPDRCIKCNAPANGIRLRRKLSWHPPAYFLLVFIGVLLYAIVAMIASKRATIDVGLCEEHYNKRRTGILVSWLMFALSIGSFVLATILGGEFVAFLGGIFLLASIICAIVMTRVVVPKKIDDQFAWLRGVSDEYLNQLPAWGG